MLSNYGKQYFPKCTRNKSDSDNRIIRVNNFTTFGKTFGEPFINEIGYSILQNSDSSIIILGGTENNNYDLTLLKTDRQGLIIWENTFGGSGYDIAYNLEKTTDSGYLISGTTKSYGQGAVSYTHLTLPTNREV